MLSAVPSSRLRAPVLSDLIPGDRVRDLLVVLGFAAAIGIFAQISIRLPFTPVPITGQTFAVLLGGMAVGTRRALAGTILYLALGLLGIPWFAAGSGGIAVATAPSFGYVVGGHGRSGFRRRLLRPGSLHRVGVGGDPGGRAGRGPEAASARR